MDTSRGPARLLLRVGEFPRAELVAALRAAGVHLNAHAETLLDEAAFAEPKVQTVQILERTVAELGLAEGAVLSAVFAAATEQGLALCPLVTGPYLRLALTNQAAASDSVMSRGHAPSGSVTVATAPVSEDDEHPKGFYLRVVDGEPWLRGYRCDDEHVWSPGDSFAFQVPEPVC